MTPPPARRPAVFLQGSLMRHVVVMSLSASIGMVSSFLVDFADLFFISRLGEAALAAAVGFAGTLLFFVFSVTIGLFIAMGALTAPLIGRGELEEARRMASSVLVVGVAVSSLTALGFWLAADELVTLLGGDGQTKRYAVRYLRIVLPAMPVSAVAMMCSALLRAHGEAKQAMWVTLWSGGINAVLDPLLIFAAGLRLDGAALATAAARGAMGFFAVSAIVRRHGGFAPLRWRRLIRHTPLIVAVAGPALLTNIATPIGNGFVTRAIAPFGDATVAGYAVIGRLSPIAFCVLYALSGAVGPIVGQNFGAGRLDRVAQAVRNAVHFAAGYSLLVWAVLTAVQGWIAEPFGLSQAGRELVQWFAWVVSPLFFFQGALFIANGSFNNLRRPLWSTVLNWGKNTVGVIPFVLAGSSLGGAPGVLIGQAVGGVLFGLLGLRLAHRLIEGYRTGRVDPAQGMPFPVLRPRPDPPFSSPRG